MCSQSFVTREVIKPFSELELDVIALLLGICSQKIQVALQVDLVVDGYSCKSLSKQCNSAKSFCDKSSKSGEDFESLIAYVQVARPKLIFCENVATMAHQRKAFAGEKPIGIQGESLRKLGYRGFYEVVNSKHFGLRHCRTRVYSVYILEVELDATRYFGFVNEYQGFCFGLLCRQCTVDQVWASFNSQGQFPSMRSSVGLFL